MKRLVVCCDGSWNTPEMESPTNVVRLASAVRTRDAAGNPQIVYYDEGVGTQGPIDKILGGAMGAGLDSNVREAYRFLAGNYEEGDEIYLFGFSRGAYTVRSLAGMIGFAGMLGRRQMTEVAEAYELYRKEKHRDAAPAAAFRSKHGTRVPPITLLGCWDTVGALGIPDKLPGIGLDERFNKRYRWADTVLGPHVEHALHALAIDERREEFKPTPMESATDGQTLLQVWFPGDHGSVGGGEHHKEPLSRIALTWMVEKIADLGLGLAIDTPFGNLLSHDHNAYFSVNRSPIYSRKPRNTAAAVFHDSALQRFVDLPLYRESVSAQQRGFLDAAARERAIQPSLRCPTTDAVLGVGEQAHAIILAERQRNDTKILMQAKGRYELSVAESQHWRDGDLPPCGPRGWRLSDAKMQPSFRGLNRMKLPLIRLARDRRVAQKANWLELVGILLGEDGREHPIRIGAGKTYTAPCDGRFLAMANDIASRVDLLDSYDDNEGWLVLDVRRVA